MEQKDNENYVLRVYVVLAMVTIIAYGTLRYCQFVNLDDNIYVTANPHVQAGLTVKSVIWAFTEPYAAFWHPVTWISHMLDFELFGLNPLGHHLMSLLFHIASTLLLFWVLKRMTAALWPSAFVAALFALHPLHVESVAWVAERKDVLSGFFWMLTMAAYVRYAEQPSFKKYLLVFLAFVMGLMAKPMLVTLPFVLLLLDYWPLGRLRFQEDKEIKTCYQIASLRQLITEKIPLFALAAVSSIISFIIQQREGATTMLGTLSLSSRIANALVSYVTYIVKMIYPTQLAVLYPRLADGLPIWKPLICFVVLATVTISVIYTARKRRYLLVGWLWYLGTLVPVIGLVQLGLHAMADRFSYLPSIGIFIMIAWGAAELVAKRPNTRRTVSIAGYAALIILLACTQAQLRHWRNSLTMSVRALAVTENNYVMENTYGAALLNLGQFEQALVQFNNALEIEPRYWPARKHIGMAYLRMGRIDDAIEPFKEVLQIENNLPEVHYNLGAIYFRQGRLDLAVEHCSETLRLIPNHFKARLGLAHIFTEQGKLPQAVEHYYKILEFMPNQVNTMNSLARILAVSDDETVRKPTEAVELARKACQLTGFNQPDLLDTLAMAYAAAGDFPQAIEFAEEAIRLCENTKKNELAEEIKKRLQLYKAGQPYRSQ